MVVSAMSFGPENLISGLYRYIVSLTLSLNTLISIKLGALNLSCCAIALLQVINETIANAAIISNNTPIAFHTFLWVCFSLWESVSWEAEVFTYGLVRM